MFYIFDDKPTFEQWDQGRLLANDCMKAGDCVRFVSSNGFTALTHAFDQNGTVVVEVPNSILQLPEIFLVYRGRNGTDCRTSFDVAKKDKPEDYVFVDNVKLPNKIPTKLSDLENDLFYKKEKVIRSFTMDDWRIDENGNAIMTITPKVKGLTPNNFELAVSYSANSGKFVASFVFNESNCSWEDLESGKFATWYEGEDAPPFELRHGFTKDESDSIVDKDVTEIVFFGVGEAPLDYFNIEFEIIDEKKIPIEYCDTSEIEAELIGLMYGE